MTTDSVAFADEPNVSLTPPSHGMVKLSWPGVIGGIAVAVGLWILLTILGLAVGLASLDPNDSVSALKSVGVGTGIWTMIVSIISLFVGGLVTARTSGILDRPGGAIHGAVLWSVTTILSLMLVGGIVRGVVGGAASTAGAAASAAAHDSASVAGAIGIDTKDLVAPLNDRLRAQGKPEVTPAQLQAVVQDAAGSAIREGRVDQEVLTASIARNTGISQADARDLANRVGAQLDTKTHAAANDVKRTAFGTADAVGKGMLWLFLGMVVGLVAAVLGSTIGVTRRQRAAAGVAPIAHGLREAHAHST